MWDKEEYLNASEAKNKKAQYEKDGFEAFLSNEGDRYYFHKGGAQQ